MSISTTLLERLRDLTIARPRPNPMSYGLTVLVIAIVAFVQAALFGSSAPWFLYTPAVLLLALFLGRGPGILATLLSGLGAGNVAARPDLPFLLTPAHWGASIIFLLTTLGLVMLVQALRTALLDTDRLREEREKALVVTAEREAFLSGVLSSSTDCIKVLDLDGRLTFMSEGGQRVMEISDFNAVAGCPWPDFWRDAGNAEAREAVEAARNGEARRFIGKADTFRGTPKWWHVAVSPITGPNGRPDRILSVSRDITELRASEEERDRFVRLAENSTDFVGMARTDGGVFYMNDAARDLVGLDDADITKLSIADFFPPDQVDTVMKEALPAVTRDGHWVGELDFRHFGTGELIPVLYSVFPITDANGALIGYGTVTRDFRDRKRADNDMRLMNGELAHRLKNVLAVVQSVAQQTLRSAPDKETASHDLGARLVALGAATDVLTGSSWRSADLREVATRALAPHGAIGERIQLDGPAITLKPEVTVAFALALHELATNAAKYGALSNHTGTVMLEWNMAGRGKDAVLSISWREQGGPPVAPPQRKGFGSTLIERSLRSYFRGKTETHFRPEGFVFELEARLGDAAITDE
ncbi:PAS domain S-box-containing protein [Sphingomonas sp. BE138]|uniref:PAS domain-containing protein n=1 Tax=Sphingomonas sp. BE138 TaxID=2817845 RepID=UPI00285A1BCB|nr:PAS domain-containing protein [Sphingomonas sp. BE138]MDR6790306.1 PAS domain S-box-containing protein [Sphingomonas sp. BE138]